MLCGAARVRTDFIGQQAPPPGGYSLARFEGYLDELASRAEATHRKNDARAVFELTYLVFSQQVLEALRAGRFEDLAWATDMACRFVEVYRAQVGLWETRDLALCRPWRMAFEAMEEGRVSVLQAMLLGINAHINYDLAFVTLGACRHAGDLAREGVAERALAGARSGVPTVRYRDFLVINALEWEAIERVQDAVLEGHNKLLYWGNRLTMRSTRFLWQRLLMEARDTSWTQTTLLVHAREGDERARVARMIDAYAASIGDLVLAFTHRPGVLAESMVGWRRRGERIDPELQVGLVELALADPVVAELALRELAFAGADPVAVTVTLLGRGEQRLAGYFGRVALRGAPLGRRRRFANFLHACSDDALSALEAVLLAGARPEELPRRAPLDRVKRRWEARLRENEAWLTVPEVRAHRPLEDALRDDARTLRERLFRLGRGFGAPTPTRPATAEGARAALARRDDRWMQICAQAALAAAPTNTEGEAMASVIERVLFLKETPVFVEVEVGVLVHVAERLEPRSLAVGERLLTSGTRAGGLYLILEGAVEVTQQRDGAVVHIAELGRGDAVGDLSALNDTAAIADCTALTPANVYFLPSAVLANLLHQHPRLAVGLIRMLSQRLIATNLRVPATPDERTLVAPAVIR
jgi:hypothetical protein